MLPLPWTLELVIRGRYLRLLCRFTKLSNIVEKVVLEAFLGGWALTRVNNEHRLEEVLELAVLLTPFVADDVIQEEHVGDSLATRCS